MRTKFTLVALFLFLLSASSVFAQQQYTFATGTPGAADYHQGPMYRSSAASTYFYSRYAYLYTASELSSEGMSPGMLITEVAWYKNNATTLGASRSNSFKILLKNSSTSDYVQATETFANLTSGATTVYDTLITLPASAGWIVFQLPTPFLYTGGSLEVITDFNQGTGTGNGSSAELDWAWRTVPDRIYGICDGTANPDPLSSTNNSIGTLTDKRPDFRVTAMFPPIPNNIGVQAFTSPASSTCAGTYNVNVDVKNYGTTQVDTFVVNWSLNGNLQTPTTFYQLLDTMGGAGANTANLNLGSQSFQSGQTYTIVAWTSDPNNVLDAQSLDDSATMVYSPALSGTYTVGGASPDYNTLTAAIDALAQNGICGPIVLDVRAGTYNEYIDIPVIAGSSSTNTITIRGAGAATTEIRGHSPNSSATIGIMGADYITIQDLSIVNTTSGTDVNGILLTSQADYNTISNCFISVPVTTSIDVTGIVVTASTTSRTSEGNNANYLTVSNCYISGGTANISFEGGGNANPNLGNRVLNTVMVNADDYGFYSDDQDGLELIGNTIDSLVSATADGIYTIGGYNYTMERNKVTSPDWGVYILDLNVNGLPFKASRFVNNMILSTSDYAVYLLDVDSLNMYHNTLRGEPALYVNDHVHMDIRNNIFTSATDQAVDFVDATTIGIMDYNLFYNGGAADIIEFGTNSYNTLAAWQSAQSLDLNSLVGDPIFISATDLHIQGTLANDVGDITVAVNVDIDGDPRPFAPAIDVDMGADEVKILNNDAGILSVNPACVGGDLFVSVKNYGVLNLSSFTVNWSVNGNLQSPVAFTGTSIANSIDTLVRLAAHGFQTGQAYDLKIWTSLPNGVNDPEKTNDSITVNGFRTGLSGTFTVGNGGDFATAEEAITALQARGMCDNVTLSFLNGTYTGQFALRNISKADPAYTLTLNSQSGNAADVTLDFPTASLGNNYIMLVENMSGVVVENLGFRRLGANNQAVHIQVEGADGLTVQNNLFISDSNSTATNTTGTKSFIYSSDLSEEHNITIAQNTFSGNSNGIWFAGSAVNYATDVLVRNNSFSVGYTAVFVEYMDAPHITQNYVTRFDRLATATYYGISISNISGAFVIDRNQVVGWQSVGYGIRVRTALASVANKGLVANNMVQFNGSTTTYAYSLESNSENVRFVHNTGLIKGGTSTAARLFYSTLAAGENELVNNVFINRGAGQAIYLTTSATPSFVKADYNILFAAGTNLAYWDANRADINALRSASGKFANSASRNIPFVSNEDLHITDFSEVLVGSPEGITEDFDGNTRCAIPYVGAHEIAPSAIPITVDFSVPDTLYAGGRGLFINSSLRSERRLHYWYVDGALQSNDVNLFYTFANTGNYDIKLVSVGCFNTDSITKTVSIIAPFDVPEVDFTADRTKIFSQEFITLTDLSTQAPTAWDWSVSPSVGVSIATQFSQDPVIFFSEPGTYEICLKADNAFGSGTQVCKTAFVEVFPVATMCADNGSTSPNGKLYDDGGPFGAYSTNSNCSFLINPCASSVNAVITDWDVTDVDDEIRIYNGAVEDPNTLLATFNGASQNPGGTVGITANSGTMLIVWKSDAATQTEGFAIEWTSTPLNQTQTNGFVVADTAFANAPVFVQSLASGTKLQETWDMEFPNNVDISTTGTALFHTYTNTGTYTIRQVVEGCGGKDTIDKIIEIIAPTSAPNPVDFSENRRTLTTNDVLQLTDISGNGPSSWRWEISPATGVQFIGDANAPVVQVSFTTTGSYDVKLVVTNGIGADSTVKAAHINVFDYCTPNSGLLSAEIGISHVSLAGINQFSTIGEKAYTDYTENGQVAQLGLGEQYSIEIARNATNQTATRKVWIDWNQDGDFTDANELVSSEIAANTLAFTSTIQVPTTAALGFTRMRVAAGYNNEPSNPCGPVLIGEFEDYLIQVLGDITKPEISLNGAATVNVEAGYGYTELGATALDAVDGNISILIQTIGTVDTTTVGVYTIQYFVIDANGNSSDTISRTVNVTPDITAPVIALNGLASVQIEVNNAYTEDGATAIDNPWGTALTVNISGTVDITQLGTYTVSYEASDASGNSTVITRSVDVIDTTAPSLSLNVDDTLYVEVNTNFVDPGVTVMDNHWTAFSLNVNGTVNTAVLGTYVLNYSATDGSGNVSLVQDRVVIVQDKTAPLISLVGTDLVNIPRWGAYTDEGYVLSDNYSDSANVLVETLGDWVSSSVEGLFWIQYKATDEEGNVAFSAKRIIDVRGTNSVQTIAGGSLNVFPNPTRGNFTLQSEMPLSAGTQITVQDALGRVISTETLRNATQEISFDLNNQAPGVYLVRVSNGNQMQTIKVNIAR
ncbi:MAG: DUF5011 domain-containing protein [Bacteroidetes bacterium]|nr:MAG: DUF5011 domain-containing protein [Bacteroidota bacterium]